MKSLGLGIGIEDNGVNVHIRLILLIRSSDFSLLGRIPSKLRSLSVVTTMCPTFVSSGTKFQLLSNFN